MWEDGRGTDWQTKQITQRTVEKYENIEWQQTLIRCLSLYYTGCEGMKKGQTDRQSKLQKTFTKDKWKTFRQTDGQRKLQKTNRLKHENTKTIDNTQNSISALYVPEVFMVKWEIRTRHLGHIVYYPGCESFLWACRGLALRACWCSSYWTPPRPSSTSVS